MGGDIMGFLRRATFGDLFVVTFTVGATFQIAMSILGVLVAVLAPSMFKMNGASATSPVQAVGVLVFLLAFALVMNAAISASGAGLWLVVRTWLPARPKSAEQD